MHQSTTPSLSQTIWPRWTSREFVALLIVQNLLPVTLGYSLRSEAVVIRQLSWWKRLRRRSLTRSHKRISMGPWRSCWNGTTSALQPEITSKGTSFMCVLSIKVPILKKSGNLFNIYIYIYMCVCVCAEVYLLGGKRENSIKKENVPSSFIKYVNRVSCTVTEKMLGPVGILLLRRLRSRAINPTLQSM